MTRDEWDDFDFTDLGRMLGSIGGWTVGCINHEENKTSVERAIGDGFVTTRIHRAPIEPKGWPCFELTDAGIEKIRELRGRESAERAERMRQWYQNNAAKYEIGES